MGKGVTDGKLANVDSIVVVRHSVLVYQRYSELRTAIDVDGIAGDPPGIV